MKHLSQTWWRQHLQQPGTHWHAACCNAANSVIQFWQNVFVYWYWYSQSWKFLEFLFLYERSGGFADKHNNFSAPCEYLCCAMMSKLANPGFRAAVTGSLGTVTINMFSERCRANSRSHITFLLLYCLSTGQPQRHTRAPSGQARVRIVRLFRILSSYQLSFTFRKICHSLK